MCRAATAGSRRLVTRAALFVVAAAILMAGCYRGSESILQRMSETQKLAAELQLQFTRAADATNLAVMADTDDASAEFAGQATERSQAVEKNAAALRQLLIGLTYSDEVGLLDEFDKRFAEYRKLDQTILDLSVENTNLKAQRLSFGPAQEAADAFQGSLEAIVDGARAEDAWQIRALAWRALAAVRDIQALQARHIAEPADDAMTRLEGKMTAAEVVARKTLTALAPLLSSDVASQMRAAQASLDSFLERNREILALSRRNSNVRSLSLTLGEKRRLTAQCEDSLRALSEALAKRGFVATR
jgi:Four helix bundle sensory module for signal transduction